MNKKQLAGMIKEMRAKKLSEASDKPVVGDPLASPNMKNTTRVGSLPGTGGRHNPDVSVFMNTTGALEKRSWQKNGNQGRSTNSYVSEEEEEELGKTDTGTKNKKNTEVININPTMKDIAGGGLTTTKGLDRK